MGMQEYMTAEALRAIEKAPIFWTKTMRQIRERLHDDRDFATDLQAFSDVPSHFRDRQVEWYYAILCYAAVLSGKIGACKVQIGEEPAEDSRMEENDRVLQATLWEPFSACAMRAYENDGTFHWDAPIRATQFVRVKRSYSSVPIELAPWAAPLEIGYTRSYRSYIHLLGPETALVRWCYGDDFIRIFKMLPDAVKEKHRRERALLFPSSVKPADMDTLRVEVEQLMLWN